MSIEALKEKARGHEQNEEWQKALDLYLQAISDQSEEEQPDIGLYNRAGDLQTRIGNVEGAVNQYEQAVDLYLEADLPNNAVAICKKVIRNLPGRASIYLKLGQIRAGQGFLAEARQNFLTYAELQQQAGEMDEAFRALSEFADLAPDDVDIRMAVAGQLEASERGEEAVEEYIKAYQQCTRLGETGQADMILAKIEELAPGTVIPDAVEDAGAEADSDLGELPGFDTSFADEGEEEEGEVKVEVEVGGLEGFDIAAGDEDGGEEEEEEAEELPMMEFGAEEDEETGDFAGFDIAAKGDEEEEEEAEELPMMAFGADEEEDEAEELPMMAFGAEEEEEAEEDEEGEELPMMEFGAEEEEEEGEEVEELPSMDMGGEEVAEGEGEEEAELTAGAFGEADHRDPGDQEYVEEVEELPELEVPLEDLAGDDEEEGEAASEAMEEAVEEAVSEEPEEGEDELAYHRRMVERAHGEDDPESLVSAYLGLAGHLRGHGAVERARAVYQQVLSIDPENEEAKAKVAEGAPAADEKPGGDSFVDLGSMILDEGEKKEKTTRWTVAAQEPSGDEQADFANMLAQFKQKVSENVADDDLTAHYDLGTAYKEMGLVDEAISEFQAALRADAEHLATYEMLGQCFLDQGEFDVAVRTLTKAVDVPHAVEDDLIGIFYYLGRAHQEAGNSGEAREFYEKVFALDINFADVTERLRALR